MQEVFSKLRSLQDILSQKFEIEKEIEDIPRNLSQKNEILTRLKQSYGEKNEEYDSLKLRVRRLKIDKEEAETQREGYEKQMDLIKTQKEYEALDKEIRDSSEKEQNLRKEIQKEERALEELEESLRREEEMIKEQEADLEEEKLRIKSVYEEKEQDLAALKAEEDKITPGLDDDILFKFERIIRNKSGRGIVPVKNGICTGCHMMLPGQFVNDIREGDGILFCPYCSRILYHGTVEETQTEVGSAEIDMGGLADLVGDFDSDF